MDRPIDQTISELLETVSAERMYQDILIIQGIRHPSTNVDGLRKARFYIKSLFSTLGMSIREQEFHLKGIEEPFYNIEGRFDEESNEVPQILITSHYDTVYNSPGANDNGSAVAIMLEAARVLNEYRLKTKKRMNIRFVSFTLEEGDPRIHEKLKELGIKYGFLSDSTDFLTYRMHNLFQKVWDRRWALYREGNDPSKVGTALLEEFKDDLDENEQSFFKQYFDFWEEISPTDSLDSWIGKTALLGSDRYVGQLDENGPVVKGVINLETIGYTDSKPNSNIMPVGITPGMFPSSGTDPSYTVGDFAAIAADRVSQELGKTFFEAAQKVELPSILAAVPFDYKILLQQMPDFLRSDHAPFWKKGIPALMITDMANFRYPFYHTEADTIDKLDFKFMKKVCRAVVLAALNLMEE